MEWRGHLSWMLRSTKNCSSTEEEEQEEIFIYFKFCVRKVLKTMYVYKGFNLELRLGDFTLSKTLVEFI